jgi:hypothetical protein
MRGRSESASGGTTISWWSVPYRSATSRAAPRSSKCRSSKPTVKVRTGSVLRSAASATSVEESRPPERSTPTGTSAIRCAETESRRRSRSSSASVAVSVASSERLVSARGFVKRSSRTSWLPCSHTSTVPGGSFRIPRKIVSGAGTNPNARNASSALTSIVRLTHGAASIAFSSEAKQSMPPWTL